MASRSNRGTTEKSGCKNTARITCEHLRNLSNQGPTTLKGEERSLIRNVRFEVTPLVLSFSLFSSLLSLSPKEGGMWGENRGV